MDHRLSPSSTNPGCLERAIDTYLDIGTRVLTYFMDTPEGRKALKGGLRGCCLPLFIGVGVTSLAIAIWDARLVRPAAPERGATCIS